MKQNQKRIFSILIPMFTLLLSACTSNASQQKTDTGNTTGNGFAVLELFTSEGCSSCPPAEKLLEEMQQEVAGKQVYILAYHVDYWDRLGWKDHFSDHAFSNRQYEYSSHFNGQVYTPQLIVNGITEGVGSDASFVRNNIDKMLSRNSTFALKISAKQQSDKLSVSYETNETVKYTRLEIAIVQKHAISNVTRGENEGRTLSHAQIVRSLSAFELGNKTKGTEKVPLPTDFNTKDFEIIGLIHNTDSGEIIAATRISIDK